MCTNGLWILWWPLIIILFHLILKQWLANLCALLTSITTAVQLPVLINKSNYISCAIRYKSQTILVDENCYSTTRDLFLPKKASAFHSLPSSIKIPLKFYKKISFRKFSHLYLCYELARCFAACRLSICMAARKTYRYT